MKAFIETTHPVRSKAKEKTKEASDGHGAEDSYEPGMSPSFSFGGMLGLIYCCR